MPRTKTTAKAGAGGAASRPGSDPGVVRRSRRTLAQFALYEAVLRTAGELERDFATLLKGHDLTTAQYNVLRILRGSGEIGLACGEVGSQLFHRDPDVTRLVDRLHRRGLVERVPDARDRRVIRTRATKPALALLAELDAQVDAVHEAQLGHLDEADLKTLKTLLDTARRALPDE